MKRRVKAMRVVMDEQAYLVVVYVMGSLAILGVLVGLGAWLARSFH